jgi:hypothetical protein
MNFLYSVFTLKSIVNKMKQKTKYNIIIIIYTTIQ